MAGRLVGKSDFNENPVVSPDLDLDFGLRLRVCQKSQHDCNLFSDAFLGGVMFTELCNNCTINNTGILAAITFHVILNLGGFATSKLFIDAFDTCH